MSRKKIESTVLELVQPILDRNGFELVDVEYVKEMGHWYLRVYIDKPGGITIDDCEIVSEELSEALDEADPIEHSYFLEVSSPGLDRPLKTDRDFERYRHETVEVKLYQAYEGSKVYEGELLGLKDGKVCIRHSSLGEMAFDRDKVASVKRVVRF